MKVASQICCPACSGVLRPAVLVCDRCQLKVEANFAPNEFASLNGDDLHLLRIFVHCEGRIREMESALGVSYPTIKSRLAELKRKLGVELGGEYTTGDRGQTSASSVEPGTGDRVPEAGDNQDGGDPPIGPKARQVLAALEKGEVSVEQAVCQLRGQTGGGQS